MFHWDTIGTRWEEAKLRLRDAWSDLTDDEIAQMRGERQELIAILERKYGWSHDEAARQADDWASRAHDGLSAG